MENSSEENNSKLVNNIEIRQGNGENKPKYLCTFCEMTFSRRDGLDRHLFMHTGIKNYTCDYWGCGKCYTNSSHLKRHMKSHQAKPKPYPYVCEYPDCVEGFTNFRHLTRHYKENHESVQTYNCDHCSSSYRRKFELKRHLKNSHNIGKFTFYCEKCENGYFNEYAFLRHIKSHKSKECDICHEMFDKWTQLVAHKREKHPKQKQNFECDLCGKTFCGRANIKHHMRIHTTNDLVFACHYENCSKYYTVKRNLTAHIRSKHEGKKFVCEICKVKLSTKQKLQSHVAAHDDPVKSKLIKKSNIELILGIKFQRNTREELLKEIPVKNIIDGISTESEFSDNN